MPDVEATKEQREFLLASLDDLDAEYAAGDLDEADYRALRSDYTTRAAAAIRSLEEGATAKPGPTRSWRRFAIWTALIVVVASLAGVWVAQFSGSRSAGESITGDIRNSVRTRLFRASELLGTDPGEAIEIYDDVLLDEPSNAEALTYRGWLTNLAGDQATGRDFVEDAVIADPTYPDARVFAAVIALRSGDAEGAAGHLAALDKLDVPPFIEQLVEAQGLRVGVVEARLLTGEPDAFAASGLTIDEVARAADALLETQDLERALALYGVLLGEARDDVDVVTEAGWFLGRVALAGGAELAESMATADELLTDALAIDPQHAPAIVYRAFVRLWQEDLDGARADLSAYDALDTERPDLEFLVRETGLREELG
jgi:tetratricopeptide (TPR) repeat protein